METWSAGPRNDLTDVAGLAVGHHQRKGDGWLTGTSVVLAPPEGAVGGVDVRGGGPGTRETALLDPLNMVERVHAVTLTGGSAFGLAAADGVMRTLYAEGRGLPMGEPGQVVPIVPGAVVFDLGRGGDFGCFPDADFGEQACRIALAAQVGATHAPAGADSDDAHHAHDPDAYDTDAHARPHGTHHHAHDTDAHAHTDDRAHLLGSLGAGTGTQTGGLRGGIGTASVVLDTGEGPVTLAALVVVNAVGSAVDPATGELWGARHLLEADVHGIPGWPEGTLPQRPGADDLEASHRAAAEANAAGAVPRTLATTIGVVATDATLTKAQSARLACSGHDGMARAISPIHTMFDGDTLFGLSTTAGPAPDPATFHRMLHAAGEVVTRSIVRAMLAADSVSTPADTWRSYREAFPSALG